MAGVGERARTQTSKSVSMLISLTHCMNAGVTNVLQGATQEKVLEVSRRTGGGRCPRGGHGRGEQRV